MKDSLNSLRRQLLAGIISESAYEEKKQILSENIKNSELSKEEKLILNDILSDALNEANGFSSVLTKVKNYAKKGLITASLLTAILSNPAFSQEQKDQIKKTISTEMQTNTSGEDLLNKFDKLLAKYKPTSGEFKKISGPSQHASSYERSKDTIVYGDKGFSYENSDFLNPNVDLADINENLDSKVIQQKYNWIIKNMNNIKSSNKEEFDTQFEKLKNAFKARFGGSELDIKKIGDSDIIVFDHIFKQNDGFAQGPKNYKTIEGEVIKVGDRIPKGSHVIDFYGGDISEKQDISKQNIKDTVNMVQLKMKPVTVPLEGTKEEIQNTIKNFRKVFSKYGEVIPSGSYITLDPTYIGMLEKDKANDEVKRLNDEMKKIGDEYGLDFKGSVFSKADSVDKVK